MRAVLPPPPGLLVAVLWVLITSQLLFLLWPGPKARYPAVVLTTGAGFALGQIWAVIGLPGIGIGEASLLPGVAFAAGLYPMARRLRV